MGYLIVPVVWAALGGVGYMIGKKRGRPVSWLALILCFIFLMPVAVGLAIGGGLPSQSKAPLSENDLFS